MKLKKAFILPAIFFVIILNIFPLFYAFQISLTDWDLHQSDWNYVGLANYVDTLLDPDFANAVRFTITYGFTLLGIQIPLGFALAFLLDRRIRGKRFFITIALLPSVLAGAVTAVVMKWMFSYNYGLVNYFLGLIGIGKIVWLSDPAASFWALIFTNLWAYTPLVALMFYAGLRSLPRAPIEAARMDGASRLQTIGHVIIPMMRPLIFFVLIIRTIDAFRLWDVVMVLTGGGPARTTETVAVYIYRMSFRYLFIGRGAATSVLFLFLLSGFIILYIVLVYRKEIGELK